MQREPLKLPGADVIAQLEAAQLKPWLSEIVIGPKSVTATIRQEQLPNFLITMRARKEDFAEGVLFGLHLDVGDELTDFRSFRGKFGKGSMQIVLDKRTGRFYADVDLWNPYADLVNFVGHTGEVLANWFRRGKGERHGSVDSVGTRSASHRGDDHGDSTRSTG